MKQSEPMKEEWIIQQIVWGYWLSSSGGKKNLHFDLYCMHQKTPSFILAKA